MRQIYGAQIDVLAGQVPAQVLLTDPFSGLLLGRFPTQGSLFPRLRSLKLVCMPSFIPVNRQCNPAKYPSSD
jgi:hypothetical protein